MPRIFQLLFWSILISHPVFSQSTYNETAKILPMEMERHLKSAKAGQSVSVDGDVAVVGVPGVMQNFGMAYVMQRIGDVWNITDTLMAPDGASEDYFGWSVSISDSTIVVGAYNDDDMGTNSGSVYVYDYSDGIATPRAKLTASDGGAYHNFGYSVSINGRNIVVGANRDDDIGDEAGSVYVFEYFGGTATQQAKINASDGEAYQNFGHCVSISGGTILVGVKKDGDLGDLAGAAYVFDYYGDTAIQRAKLLPSDGEAYDYFGRSVSVHGSVIVVGASGDGDVGHKSGSAYVFDYSNGMVTQQAKITASDGTENDYFGSSVSIKGSTILIGAPGDDDKGPNSGSVYVFDYFVGSTTEQTKLVPSSWAADDEFGWSVSTNGSNIVVGVPGDDDFGGDAGAAYMFDYSDGTASSQFYAPPPFLRNAFHQNMGAIVAVDGDVAVVGANAIIGYEERIVYLMVRSGGAWLISDTLSAADGDKSDSFGSSIAINGNTIVVGAMNDDDNGSNSGSAYVFDYSLGTATQQAKLTASDGETGDQFGSSVSVDGTTIVVGAENGKRASGSNSGVAYVFDYSDGTATQKSKFTHFFGNPFDEFGSSVAISGSTIVVGAPMCDDLGANSGSAYVFDYNGDTVIQRDEFFHPNPNDKDYFGSSVAISGRTIVVGVPGDDNSGSAIVFDYSDGTATQQVKLTPSDGDAGEGFGRAVSIDDGIIAVGASGDDDMGDSSGSVYVFEYSDGITTEKAKLIASDGEENDSFGSAVSVSDSTIIIGADGEDELGLGAGAVYVFVECQKPGNQSISGFSTTMCLGETISATIDSSDWFAKYALYNPQDVRVSEWVTGTGNGLSVLSADTISLSGNYYLLAESLSTWECKQIIGESQAVIIHLPTAGVDVQTACNSYTWIDGNTYTSSNNTAQYALSSDFGCDSVVTLDLTITSVLEKTNQVLACESYTWIDGVTYTASTNSPQFIIPSNSGCDTLVTLDLTIFYPEFTTETITTCDSLVWIDGNTYYSSNNNAQYTLTNQAGCDSVVTLDLTIIYPEFTTETISTCDSLVWIDGNTYYSSNNSAQYILSNQWGCDSVVTLDLQLYQGTEVWDSISGCDPLVWIDGNTYNSDTDVPMYFAQTNHGCDSLIHLVFTRLGDDVADVQEVCDSLVWIDGNTYFESNNDAKVMFQNQNQCDSTVHLDLTVHHSSHFIFEEGSCEAVYYWQGKSFTESTTETTVLKDSYGCDSVLTLDLTFYEFITPGIELEGNTLISTHGEVSFCNWLDCDDDYNLVPGMLGQEFTPEESGRYAALVVTQNGCVDTTDCVSVELSGIDMIEEQSLSIYPNPTYGNFYLQAQGIIISEVEIVNPLGQLVEKILLHGDKKVSINLPSGVYYVLMPYSEFLITKKVVVE